MMDESYTLGSVGIWEPANGNFRPTCGRSENHVTLWKADARDIVVKVIKRPRWLSKFPPEKLK